MCDVLIVQVALAPLVLIGVSCDRRGVWDMIADYLVVTTIERTRSDRWFAWLVDDPTGKGDIVSRTLLGARGLFHVKLRAFVGGWDNGRWMLSVSGPAANDALELVEPGDSVARLDLQETILVQDADLHVRSVQARGRFTQRLIDPAPARGVTRYIGVRKSGLMLRVYNKSVESGIEAPVGEYARWEIELRNERADYALACYREQGRPGLNAYAQSLLDRMTSKAIQVGGGIVLPEVDRKSTSTERWLMTVVLPCLRKLEVRDKALYDKFIEHLDLSDSVGDV